MKTNQATTTRRRLLLGAGALAAVYAGSRFWLTRPKPLAFEPLVSPHGYRRLTGVAATSRSIDPFLGLGEETHKAPHISDDELCANLFSNRCQPCVPVAYFFDYYCPVCRPLSKELQARAANGDIALSRHEWPILGEPSTLVARATLAADILGAKQALLARLDRSVGVMDQSNIRAAAQAIGLDAHAFGDLMFGDHVAQKLGIVRGLAARFGMYATPSMVIGRTYVVGALNKAQLDALIRDESEQKPICWS